jgi:uncharacterized cupredoxin-like copper-binding protein
MKRAGLLAGLVCVLVLVSCGGSDTATPVSVDLSEWAVTPSVSEVEAGSVTFTATNRSTAMIHELALLRIEADGERKNIVEIEDIDPGKSGSVTKKLSPGRYELACLIAPGEAGSTVDHYQTGMRTAFTVR